MFRSEKLLIVEIADREVRFLNWHKDWGRKPPNIGLQIYPLGVEGQAANDSKLAALLDVLRTYRSQKKAHGKLPVYLLLPLENGFSREFSLPWIKKRERGSALRYYLEHEFPFLADGWIYTHQFKEEKEQEYLIARVTALRKDVLAFYANCLQEAGYVLKGVEYTVAALGSFFGLHSKARILWLQELTNSSIQLILFKDGYPDVIRELSIDQAELNKYHLYVGLNDLELPVEYLSTDGSLPAEKAASILLAAGFVQERLAPSDLAVLPSQELQTLGYKAFALWGEKLRIAAGLNIDFYNYFRRRLKVKTIAALLGLWGIVCALLGSFLWYPALKQHLSLRTELATLQARQEKLLIDEDQIAWKEWKGYREISSSDLSKMQQILEKITPNLKLARLNYKQSTLYLWGECRENASISQVLAAFTAEGWREPVLIDYKYQEEKIVFVLSVQR